MSYATVEELSAAVGKAANAQTTPHFRACLEAATTEIDNHVDRPEDDPIPEGDALANRVCLLRAVEWHKANDAAWGVVGMARDRRPAVAAGHVLPARQDARPAEEAVRDRVSVAAPPRMLALTDVRARAAAALAPATDDDPEVHSEVVDSLTPPALVLVWDDPWLTANTFGPMAQYEAQLTVLAIASEGRAGAGRDDARAARLVHHLAPARGRLPVAAGVVAGPAHLRDRRDPLPRRPDHLPGAGVNRRRLKACP